MRYERGTSASVALLSGAVIQCSPVLVAANPLTPSVDMRHVSGHLLLGYTLIALAFATFLCDLTGRLDWTPQERDRFVTSRISLPLTLIAPTALGLWLTDNQDLVYPVIACTYLWMLAHIYRLLLIIRATDNRATLVATLYLIGFTFAVGATAARLTLGYNLTSCWAWRLGTICALFVMLGSTVSWVRKRRYMNAHMWRTIRREKPLKRRGVPVPRCQFTADSADA
jgi:hypothetical protein